MCVRPPRETETERRKQIKTKNCNLSSADSSGGSRKDGALAFWFPVEGESFSRAARPTYGMQHQQQIDTAKCGRSSSSRSACTATTALVPAILFYGGRRAYWAPPPLRLGGSSGWWHSVPGGGAGVGRFGCRRECRIWSAQPIFDSASALPLTVVLKIVLCTTFNSRKNSSILKPFRV